MLESVKPRDLTVPPDAAGVVTHEIGVPDLGLSLGERSASRKKDKASGRTAFALAALLHVGLLTAFAVSWTRDDVGSAGQSLEAISVEIALVPATGVSAVRTTSPPAEALETPLAPAPATIATPPAKPETARPPEAPTIVAKPDPTPPDPDTLVLDVREAPRREPTKVIDPPTQIETVRDADTPAQKAEVAAPAEPSPPAPPPSQRSAAAAPSPGAMQAYARDVVAALSTARPKTTSRIGRGTVRISFSISESGVLEMAEVKATSGNPHIDEAALAAVRRTPFKAPPPGMTASQRTYEVPYQFR